ncbi:hypothetical protein AB5I41_17705 [Sphingomonas sp. MMS24-JH45]
MKMRSARSWRATATSLTIRFADGSSALLVPAADLGVVARRTEALPPPPCSSVWSS